MKPAGSVNQRAFFDPGFHREPWIPASARMTNSTEFRVFTRSSIDDDLDKKGKNRHEILRFYDNEGEISHVGGVKKAFRLKK